MNMNDLFMQLYVEKYGKKIPREVAESIVKTFKVTDGSGRDNGEKWTFEEAKGLAEKLGADWEKISKCEYYLILNKEYSEHIQTVKKHGLPETFIGELAMDWFKDIEQNETKTFDAYIHL